MICARNLEIQKFWKKLVFLDFLPLRHQGFRQWFLVWYWCLSFLEAKPPVFAVKLVAEVSCAAKAVEVAVSSLDGSYLPFQAIFAGPWRGKMFRVSVRYDTPTTNANGLHDTPRGKTIDRYLYMQSSCQVPGPGFGSLKCEENVHKNINNERKFIISGYD